MSPHIWPTLQGWRWARLAQRLEQWTLMSEVPGSCPTKNSPHQWPPLPLLGCECPAPVATFTHLYGCLAVITSTQTSKGGPGWLSG